MLKFWRTSENAWAYVLTSVIARVETNTAAINITDRDGIPHRIATGGTKRPVRLTVDFPENAMALTNGESIRFDDYLIGNAKTGNGIVVFENTRKVAYKCVIETVDERVLGGCDRIEIEPLFVRVVFHVTEAGVFTDWDDIFSAVWGV
jgi:hypothetical protein